MKMLKQGKNNWTKATQSHEINQPDDLQAT